MSVRLSMRAYRAAALYGLLQDPTNRILTVADIYLLLRQRWATESIQKAIGDLVEEGVLAEGPMGELIVGPGADRKAA